HKVFLNFQSRRQQPVPARLYLLRSASLAAQDLDGYLVSSSTPRGAASAGFHRDSRKPVPPERSYRGNRQAVCNADNPAIRLNYRSKSAHLQRATPWRPRTTPAAWRRYYPPPRESGV